MKGDFSKSQIQTIQLKAESIWADSAAMTEYIPNAEAAIVVQRNQTARFRELDRDGKKNEIGISWIKACEAEVTKCSSDCELYGEEVETDVKKYEYDECFETSFKIDATKLEKNIYNFDEVVARAMLKHVKLMDERWAQTILAKLKGYSGINQYPAPFTYDAANNVTVVPSSLYGNPLGFYTGFQLPTLWTKQMLQNQMQDVYFLDNGRLWTEYQNSILQRGSTDGMSVSGLSRALSLRVNFDLFNFAKAEISNVTTFAIDRSAVAFKTQTKHPDTPEVLGGKIQQTIYTVDSLVIPGVKYDVFYQLSCTNESDGAHYWHTFKIKSRGIVALNPEGCPVTVGGVTYNPTGITAFVSDDEFTP